MTEFDAQRFSARQINRGATGRQDGQHSQVGFLNVENLFPRLETFSQEAIEVLAEAKSREDGFKVGHPRQ